MPPAIARLWLRACGVCAIIPLTRQFALEYAVHFGLLLPALTSLGLPIPLGGTSNHFRADILRAVGAWDPYNVTEDADLGMRLARFGYRCGVIASRTREEACSSLGNWTHQRSRWLKGWLQTWLVHAREPRRLWRDVGPRGFLVVQLMMLGVIVSALLHPLWAIGTLWSFAAGIFFPDRLTWTATLLSGIYLAVFTSGYLASMLCAALAMRRQSGRVWWLSLLTMPAYWLLMSPAAWLALWQFFREPFVWNKTRHGVSKLEAGEGV